MNPLNYASLPASQRLQSSGIVIETEAGWYKIFRPGCHSFDMVLSMRSGNEKFYGDNYPAPSMAEVWRELPDSFIEKRTDHYYCSIALLSAPIFPDENPTDALINLLIWTRKEANHA